MHIYLQNVFMKSVVDTAVSSMFIKSRSVTALTVAGNISVYCVKSMQMQGA